jgi:adenine-specific DNA-methyltransferase
MPAVEERPCVSECYSPDARVTLYLGDCIELLNSIPDGAAQLVVTSPPYNLGKEYETKTSLDVYLANQEHTLTRAARILSEAGSLCWQVGNYIDKGQVFPLDSLLYPIFMRLGFMLRNRIIWRFEHGLHCQRRLSGRYETIMWLTKSDRYVFELDPIRVPPKYPGKRYYKGPKAGQYSCNPLGKNPGDVWEIPNVKHNHVEKTIHPCQFPIELVERLVLSMTRPDDLVVDPYVGVGTTAVAALLHGRRAAGSDVKKEYLDIARDRVNQAIRGTLRVRPMGAPIYKPSPGSALLRRQSGGADA